MLGQDDLVTAMTLECQVCEHLFAQLPRENWQATLDYRPTPGQRSTLELLRYLSYCGIGAALKAVEGSWDGFRRVAQRGEGMAGEDFPAAMERQRKEIAELLAPLTDEDLATRRATNPPGQEMTLGQALYEMPIRWLVGYRMQLFLYARALGAEVGTADCWYGVSQPKPKPS